MARAARGRAPSPSTSSSRSSPPTSCSWRSSPPPPARGRASPLAPWLYAVHPVEPARGRRPRPVRRRRPPLPPARASRRGRGPARRVRPRPLRRDRHQVVPGPRPPVPRLGPAATGGARRRATRPRPRPRARSLLLPFALADAGAVRRELFGYGGIADFGWTGVLRGAEWLATGALPRSEARFWPLASLVSKALFLAALGRPGHREGRGRLRLPAERAILATLLAFASLYGLQSAQYLLWAVPLGLLRPGRTPSATPPRPRSASSASTSSSPPACSCPGPSRARPSGERAASGWRVLRRRCSSRSRGSRRPCAGLVGLRQGPQEGERGGDADAVRRKGSVSRSADRDDGAARPIARAAPTGEDARAPGARAPAERGPHAIRPFRRRRPRVRHHHAATPWPWINYLGSEDFFSLISQHGRRLLLLPGCPPAPAHPLPLQQRPGRRGRPLLLHPGRGRLLDAGVDARQARARLLRVPRTAWATRDHGRAERGRGRGPLLRARSGRTARSSGSWSRNTSKAAKTVKLFSFVEFCLWNAWTT